MGPSKFADVLFVNLEFPRLLKWYWVDTNNIYIYISCEEWAEEMPKQKDFSVHSLDLWGASLVVQCGNHQSSESRNAWGLMWGLL